MCVLQQGETKSVCELLLHTEGWTRVKGGSEHFQINYHRVVHDGKRAGGWGREGRGRRRGATCRMSGSGEGSFPGLKTQIIRRARRVRGGNVIAERGCGSLEAWAPLLVGRT